MKTVEMPVAVRAWTTRTSHQKPATNAGISFTDIGPSAWSLVFDTETTTDPGQGLRVGAYQLRHHGRIRQAGLFYEPDALSAEELETVKLWAKEHGLVLLTRAEFVDGVFLPTAWDRRGLIIGHNLPFDIARLSISHYPPQVRGGWMRGGFGFRLSTDEPASHVAIKRANSGAAFIHLTIPAGMNPERRNRQRGGRQQNHHGYFLDTATLGGAMFGGRPSLGRLADLLGTEHRKGAADHGEVITADYLEYLLNDVQVTSECAAELQQRYAAYQLPRRADEIYSEASIGKAHLQKMNLTPFRALNRWPEDITAIIMETYYGGRAECSIRRVPVPGVYVDFASQYPTVFALQGLHVFLAARKVRYLREDPEHVQRLLDELILDQVLQPEFWKQLPVLVQIAPNGDRLPTRARYNAPRSTDAGGTYNVGVPYRYGRQPQWYTLAHACASKLMTGKAPKILAVLRFTADGIQDELQQVDIAGNPHYTVDPAQEDFIRKLVELREDVRADQQAAQEADETDLATRLAATQQAMKITANGTAYGSAIELNPQEHRKGAWTTIHLPDGSNYRVHRDRTEEPGSWFHPLISTLVAGAGRLLLATVMHLVTQVGGSWAFCDTDSLFIIATPDAKLIPCPGGQHQTLTGQPAIKALSWGQTTQIVQRFTSLDPYHGPGHPKSILKIEAENFDPNTGEQREIECFAIAAKRYGLFTRRSDGTPAIVTSGDKKKRSEHGLGHLLPPNAPHPDLSDRAWIDELWEHLLHLELGFHDHPEPTWFSEPAVGRLTVTSQRDMKAFATYNHERPYPEQVKPWGVLTIAHPAITERARQDGSRCVIAPFERDPAKRLQANWIDRDHPERPTGRIHTATEPEYRKGSTRVLSYRDYFTQYRHHPESKALDPTDSKRCHTWTRGQLQPWHITATELTRVGKESNRLTDSHQPADQDEDEQVIEYPAPTRKCRGHGCEATVSGRQQWHSDACRKRNTRSTAPGAARDGRRGSSSANTG